MRKVLGLVALFVGAFLLVAAALGQFWAPSHAEKTPLDTDTTTRLTGTAQKLNPTTGKVDDVKVLATGVTKADTKKSDGKVIAFVTTTCLVVDTGTLPPSGCLRKTDPRLITVSEPDTFANDRHTAASVTAKKYLATTSVPHDGLTNKWPFDAQKKTYPFWDGTLGKAVDATYDGRTKVDGLDAYQYKVSVPPTDADVLSGTPGKYSTDKVITVDPVTGSILRQTQHEVRTFPNGDPILDLDIAYTAGSTKAAVDQAKSNITSLNLLTKVIPIVGLVLGLVLLVLGLFLLLGRPRSGAHASGPRQAGGSTAVTYAG